LLRIFSHSLHHPPQAISPSTISHKPALKYLQRPQIWVLVAWSV
jgi:hypothetical protein